MTEKDFRVHLSAASGQFLHRVYEDRIVCLAKEAGIVFDPEPASKKIPYLRPLRQYRGSVVAAASDLEYGWGYLDAAESEEVIRRCRAVEEALEVLRTCPIEEMRATLLNLLEGGNG